MAEVKVRLSEFVSSSKRYAEERVRMNLHQGPESLRGTVPAELSEEFLSLREPAGAVVFSLTRFIDRYGRYAAQRATEADSDHDGFLSATDARRLPVDLQDSFKTLVRETGGVGSTPSLTARPRDVTSPAVLAQEKSLRAATLVDYESARRRAVSAVLTHELEGDEPRAQVRAAFSERAQPLSEARLDAELRTLLDAASVELVPSVGSDGSLWRFRFSLPGEQGALLGAPLDVTVDAQSGRAELVADAR